MVNNYRVQIVLVDPGLPNHCAVLNSVLYSRYTSNFFVFICDGNILGIISRDAFLMEAYPDDYACFMQAEELWDLRSFYLSIIKKPISKVHCELDEWELEDTTPEYYIREHLKVLIADGADWARDNLSSDDWDAIFSSQELSLHFLEQEKIILHNAAQKK